MFALPTFLQHRKPADDESRSQSGLRSRYVDPRITGMVASYYIEQPNQTRKEKEDAIMKEEEEASRKAEAQRMINNILKRVDQLLKTDDLETALLCLNYAKVIDPKNMYVRAFEERIAHLRIESTDITEEAPTEASPNGDAHDEHGGPRRFAPEQVHEKELGDAPLPPRELGRVAEEKARETMEEAALIERRRMKLIEEHNRRDAALLRDSAGRKYEPPSEAKQLGVRAEEEAAKIASEARAVEQRRARLPEKAQNLVKEGGKLQAAVEQAKRAGTSTSTDPQPAATVSTQRTEDYKGVAAARAPQWVQAYAQTLRKAWSDGLLSKDEEGILACLRSAFSITQDEHRRLEEEAHWEIYQQTMVDAWADGVITAEDAEKLDGLRLRFRISPEAHVKLERYIRHTLLKLSLEYLKGLSISSYLTRMLCVKEKPSAANCES